MPWYIVITRYTVRSTNSPNHRSTALKALSGRWKEAVALRHAALKSNS